jgi:hypothetical protein
MEEKDLVRALCKDPTFEGSSEFKKIKHSDFGLAIRSKRTAGVIITLHQFLKNFSLVKVYTLDKESLVNMIRDYTKDLDIIKKRYGCKIIQLPKIAGLMANLIVKHHPVVPIEYKKHPIPKINEVFAVYHGICICSDFSDEDEISKFCQTEEHDEFFSEMSYLLGRSYTPENLIMVFKTLCLFKFPNFKKSKSASIETW